MRMPVLILVAAIGILLGQGSAAAEKVKTNQTTNLMSRPGEQAKVLLSVKSGQSMTLLAKDGRWLKVRVKGRTGYVPRSKVDMASDEDITRNTRRRPFVEGRGKKRGFGGSAPEDRVGADATEDRGGGGSSSSGDEEDEEEEDRKPPPKKVVAKTTAKSKVDEDEDEEDEEEEDAAPAKKPVAKVAQPKPPVKAPVKGSDDEDEEDEDEEDEADKPAAKAASKGNEDEDEDDEETDGPAKREDEAEKRKTVRVTKKVAVREEPDDEAEPGMVVRPTDTMFPGETKGSWTFIENAEGDGGWIQSDMLEFDGAGGSGKRAIDVHARAGLNVIQQGMRTAGSDVLTVPDNYNIKTRAFTIAVGGGILIPKGKWLVGGEATYEYSKALSGGIGYDPDGDGPMATKYIGLTVSNVNVRATAGIDFKKKSGMALLGRLGYRYQGYLISDVDKVTTTNLAKIPSEVVKGPTIGAALKIPTLTKRIGLQFALDTMLFGASVRQTVGLEDGASPSVTGVVLGAGLTYQLGNFDLQATYDLNYMGMNFGTPPASSMRGHMGMTVKRTDIFHLITVGIAKGF